MRILGIDPGLQTVGLGWLDADGPHHITALDWCAITTESGLPLPQRLAEIAADFRGILDEVKPDLVVVEKLFFAVNATSAIDVAQARGAMVAEAAGRGIEVLEATPLQMKLAITGDGQADKRQIQDMLMQCLKLDVRPTPVDAADALALAYYGALQAHTLTLSSPSPSPRPTR